MPFALIPFLLLVVPIVEIAAFIAIGGQIGIWWTLLMILITAIIGSVLLRVQGFNLIQKIRTELSSGKIPGRALGHGFLMLIAGILLLTPGFVTDAIGFLLFVPLIRDLIWKAAKSRVHVILPEANGSTSSDRIWPKDAYDNKEPYAGETLIDLDEDEYSSKPDVRRDSSSPWNKNSESSDR